MHAHEKGNNHGRNYKTRPYSILIILTHLRSGHMLDNNVRLQRRRKTNCLSFFPSEFPSHRDTQAWPLSRRHPILYRTALFPTPIFIRGRLRATVASHPLIPPECPWPTKTVSKAKHYRILRRWLGVARPNRNRTTPHALIVCLYAG